MGQGKVDQSTSGAAFVPDHFNRLSARMWIYGPRTAAEQARWFNSRERKELMRICEAEKAVDIASVKAGHWLIPTSPNFVQMTDAEFDRWYHSPARVEWVRVLMSTSDRVRVQERNHRNVGFSSASNTSPAQPLTARITAKLNDEGTRFQKGASRISHNAPVGSLLQRMDALRMRVTEELRIAHENCARFAELNPSRN
jgi:hypothetical protein